MNWNRETSSTVTNWIKKQEKMKIKTQLQTINLYPFVIINEGSA
jgi:hypothetical protein